MVGDSLRLFEIWKGDERLRQIPPFSYPPLTVCDRPSTICLAYIAGGLWTPISQSRILFSATLSAGRACLRGLSAWDLLATVSVGARPHRERQRRAKWKNRRSCSLYFYSGRTTGARLPLGSVMTVWARPLGVALSLE